MAQSPFPLVTWIMSWPAFTVDVTVGAVTETLSLTDGTGYGWLTTGTESSGYRSAASTSLAYAFAALLDTHSRIALNGGAYYGVTDFGTVQAGSGTVGWGVRMTLTGGTFATIAATSNASALALFGLKVGDALEGGTTLAKITAVNRRTAGIWRPTSTEGNTLEPVYTAIGSGAVSPYDGSVRDRMHLSGILSWAASWTYVEAADISREILTLANYGPLATRASGDANGTLDDLLYAAARNGALTLAKTPETPTAAIDYRECVLASFGDIARDAFTTPISVGSRRYNVTLPLRETRAYEPST